jgi:hypothetical protein
LSYLGKIFLLVLVACQALSRSWGDNRAKHIHFSLELTFIQVGDTTGVQTMAKVISHADMCREDDKAMKWRKFFKTAGETP